MKEVRSRHRGTRAYFPPCMEGAKFMWLGPFSLRLRRSPYSLPIVSLFYANAELTYALRRRGINKKTAAERRALRCLRDSWKKSFVGDAADRRDAFLRGHRPPFFFFFVPLFHIPSISPQWRLLGRGAKHAPFTPRFHHQRSSINLRGGKFVLQFTMLEVIFNGATIVSFAVR